MIESKLSITIDYDHEDDAIERLVEAAAHGLEDVCLQGETSPSQVLSAAFTLLDRLLRGTRKLQSPVDRQHNARELNKIFNTFISDFGRIPS